MGDTLIVLAERDLLKSKLIAAREALKWVVDEYERGVRKGYDAKISPEIAAEALKVIGDDK